MHKSFSRHRIIHSIGGVRSETSKASGRPRSKNALSREQETEIGKQFATQVEREMEVVHNQEIESWLNQAEIEIGIFSRQCLGKRRIGGFSTLRCQAKVWNRRTNRDKTKIQWKFTRKLARLKLNYNSSGHSTSNRPASEVIRDP